MENYSKRELNLMKFNIKDIYLDFIKMENKSHIENKYKLNIFYIRSYLLKNGYKVKTFLEIKNKVPIGQHLSRIIEDFLKERTGNLN